ncbi:alpha-glucosidase [Rhodoferax sp. OV413]|uniref:alpha-glucosidase family protein n=1 Tax=Rhodoferax sp. OV413 TaxID=1855285 RepID=UPI00088BB565|nr:alpha-glucosidase family protein [Rhodoferax sp. OV413]SDP25074.1 alpha-glucosidase [Rhodoferax sp. OV413]
MAQANEWWRGGVIYQIYPRSFQDSNGDGIGDLAGVVQRLPYLAELGVEAVWLSPFFQSPMKDFGYDISDYRAVDPMFGSLADFDAVVAKAHALGIKVLIDQVLSHCSDQNPWFVESRSSRDNPRADWFVWADPQDDGTPPNNWLSIFGGSAWQWDTRRCQYYMHNFLASQPDLNFHNPQVQQAALDNMQFWLDRGVDGFRLDAVNFCVHDAQLRNNPARGMPTDDPSVNKVNPYGWQRHVYDKSQPEMLDFLRRIRSLLNQYPDLMTVGEIGDDDTPARIAEYTGGGDKLHTAYSFDLLGPKCDARYIHGVVQRLEAVCLDGWPCWSVSNHDAVRVASRWQQPAHNAAWLRLVFGLQLSLRGSPCIYQGDELGLTEASVAFEDLQDPYGIAMWPEFVGRDGCRTPMVWDAAAPHAGFSSAAKTWLPVASEHLPLAAASQRAAPDSMFHFYQAMLAWRRQHAVLRTGDIELLAADDTVLAFVRRSDDAALLCAFNLGASPVRYALPDHVRPLAMDTRHALPSGELDGQTLLLPPYGALFATL